MKKYSIFLLLFTATLFLAFIVLERFKPEFIVPIAVILGIASVLYLLLLLFYEISIYPAKSAKKVLNYQLVFLCLFWLGILVIVLMCLYPPWVETTRLPNSNIKGTNPAGYAFLWHPPGSGLSYSGITIDYSRLVLQIFIAGLITCSLLYTLRIMQMSSNKRLSVDKK